MQCLIAYDAHKVRNYTRLYQLMAQWKAVRLTESLWLANLRGPADVVRNMVAGTLDNDDTTAVLELKPGSDWATLRANPAGTAWLSSYVTAAQKAA